MNNVDGADQYLTTSQAAKICKVTRFTVANWVKSGKLESVYTAGGHRRIEKKILDEFLERYCYSKSRNPLKAIPHEIGTLTHIGSYNAGRFIASIFNSKNRRERESK